MDPTDRFRVGDRNFTVLRKLLWKIDLLLAAEDVGGDIPRTLVIEVRTGRTLIKAEGSQREL